jgi:hypothetical protein
MLSSGIIDVAIGLAFIFGVTAALSSVFTELIARFLGLRGTYLLGGLRELLDDTTSQIALVDTINNYDEARAVVHAPAAPVASTAPHDEPTNGKPTKPTAGELTEPASPEPTRSATGALLGSPILRSQGMVGNITTRDLVLQPGRLCRPPRMTTSTSKRPFRV